MDEFMLTKRTIPKHAWTLPRTNIEIDMKQLNDPTRAVIVAASRENGVEHFQSFPKSINKQKFKEFLEEMRDLMPDEPVTLVMDNLGVHKCRAVRHKMEELRFEAAFTPICKSPAALTYLFSLQIAQIITEWSPSSTW